MPHDIEKLQNDNDQLLMQLGWLLERVLIKDGNIELPGYKLSEADIIISMRELKRASEEDQAESIGDADPGVIDGGG